MGPRASRYRHQPGSSCPCWAPRALNLAGYVQEGCGQGWATTTQKILLERLTKKHGSNIFTFSRSVKGVCRQQRPHCCQWRHVFQVWILDFQNPKSSTKSENHWQDKCSNLNSLLRGLAKAHVHTTEQRRQQGANHSSNKRKLASGPPPNMLLSEHRCSKFT